MSEAPNWLDLVICTPSVGVRWQPTFRHWVEYLPAIKPLLQKWAEAGKEPQIQASEGGLSVKIEDKRGLRFELEPNGLVAEFRYPVALVEPDDKIAALDFSGMPEVERYSVLLDRTVTAATDLLRAVAGLEGKNGLNVDRIGIVAAARMGRKSPPPGVAALIGASSNLWPLGVSAHEGHTSAKLELSPHHRVLCHHFLKYDHSKEEVFLKLDWQLLLTPATNMQSEDLRKRVLTARGQAQEYFDRFGEGAF
jgi:hypothetical protein